jgi:RHS repeat-associated protein
VTVRPVFDALGNPRPEDDQNHDGHDPNHQRKVIPRCLCQARADRKNHWQSSVRTEGATVQTAHYGDLSDNPTLDTDAKGNPLTSYLQGPAGLIEQRAEGATSYPLADAHGDIATMTAATGEVQSRQTYDPWGNQLSGPALQMGYLGAQERRSDPTAGLIQMGQRPYDPSLGAFTSEDPVLGHLGSAVTLDRYPYAWDNPLNRYDLNGRDVCVPTPFGSACAEEAAEDVAEGAEGIAGTGEEAISTGWDTGEEVAGAAGSGIDTAWDWTASGRGWVGDRAQDFWKALNSVTINCGTGADFYSGISFITAGAIVPSAAFTTPAGTAALAALSLSSKVVSSLLRNASDSGAC